MGEIENNYLTVQQIKMIVKETIAQLKIDECLAKPQLTAGEAGKYYGKSRVNFWVKKGLLRPICQNGKGSKIYYRHQDIIKLSELNFHD